MEIHLLAVGTRMSDWIDKGYSEYAKRLDRNCKLILKEISPPRKSKSEDPARVTRAEGELLLASVPADSWVVALDVQGSAHTTESLAERLGHWLENHRRVTLLVGGSDGLSSACLARADERWSLSPLTFPHGLVRIIVSEQIYRAHSVLSNHPYHRA